MFCNKITGEQMFNRVVDGSTAHSVLFILHVDVERFYIKMIVDGVDFIKYGKTFRGLPETLLFQKI
jgi:hypothetical protein